MKAQCLHVPVWLRSAAIVFCALCLSACASTAVKRPPAAAIASAHPFATQAGMQILAAGGNAFDAAVTVSAVLAVVEPYSSGLGGGGFWLLHRASDAYQVMIDGRERAPLAATRDMYLDASGTVVPRLSTDGALAAAIPGEPAALVHLSRNYGRLPLIQTLAPAIRLAREGFPVDEHYRRMAQFRLATLQDDVESARLFLQEGDVPPLGHRIVQSELADTLESIARRGRDGFYTGITAERLVAGVQAAGGIWTLDDLVRYEVIERQPVQGSYLGRRIVSAAPPSSGGVALVSMLNILSGFPLSDYDTTARVHVLVETMRRAYRDRAQFLGDPDFSSVPVARLTSEAHANQLRATIHPEHATPSASLPGIGVAEGGQDTTHFSVLDTHGNRVAATLTINYPFGAGVTPPGTGVLLNDEMDDFSVKPGVPNVYGLVGAEANAIAPGKRPLSSMTPTFIEHEDGIAILGTPGGSRIISMVLLASLDLVDGNRPDSWVSLPRFHHQYLPDVVQYEPGAFNTQIVEALRERGHQLKALVSTYGNMQALYWDRSGGRVYAASDPRGGGAALTGHLDQPPAKTSTGFVPAYRQP